VRNFQNDFQLSRDFVASGEHTLTLGGYASFANYRSVWNFNDNLLEVDGSPSGLDIFAVDDDTDTVVGAVTQNSFTRFGSFYRDYDADTRTLAIYANDEWQVTDRLRLDGGIRFESLRIEGVAERLETFDLSNQNDAGGLNGLETLADDAVTAGSGTFDPFSETYDEFAWAIGGNYTLTDQIAFYARANDAFRTPDPNDLAGNPAGAGDLPVNEIFQAEGGVKYDSPYLRAFVTGFFSDFTDQVFSDPVLDENGNTIEAQTLLESETIGLEAEVDVGPFMGFSVNSKITLQEPEIKGFQIVGADANPAGSDFIGNEIQRIAGRILIVEPRYDFSTPQFDGSVFLNIYNVDDRFANNGNSVILPSYTTLAVGATLDWNGFELTFTGDNLTNEIGVTEGNPRTDFFASGDSSIATFARPIVGRNFRVKLGKRF
jgi:outer membrane receptor protein involved in Fe transport